MPGLDDLWFPHVAVLLSDDDKVIRRRSPGSLSAANDDLSVAVDQGVPSEALLAGADRPVVPDLTVGILTTCANTGIPAVVVETSEAVGALTVILAISLAT